MGLIYGKGFLVGRHLSLTQAAQSYKFVVTGHVNLVAWFSTNHDNPGAVIGAQLQQPVYELRERLRDPRYSCLQFLFY